MKFTFRQGLALALLAGVTSISCEQANALVLVNDTFDVGLEPSVLDDEDDPNDVEWAPISNDPSQLALAPQDDDVFLGLPMLGTDNTFVATKNGTFGGVYARLPTLDDLNLGVGDQLRISFDLALFDFPLGPATGAGNGSGLRWGIVNNVGYGAYASTGVSDVTPTTNTELFVRQDATPESPDTVPPNADLMFGFPGLQAFEGPNDVGAATDMGSSLMTDVVYAPVFTIERLTADSVQFTAEINGATNTTIDFDDLGDDGDNVTDFSNGFFVIRTGNANSDLRIDNFVVELTASNEPAAGDFNGDGMVDNGDLNLLLGSWGAASVPPEWINGFESPVDNGELNALLGNWGFGTTTAIPEPVSLLLATAFVFIRSKRH